jgi:hypothetical protein
VILFLKASLYLIKVLDYIMLDGGPLPKYKTRFQNKNQQGTMTDEDEIELADSGVLLGSFRESNKALVH